MEKSEGTIDSTSEGIDEGKCDMSADCSGRSNNGTGNVSSDISLDGIASKSFSNCDGNCAGTDLNGARVGGRTITGDNDGFDDTGEVVLVKNFVGDTEGISEVEVLGKSDGRIVGDDVAEIATAKGADVANGISTDEKNGAVSVSTDETGCVDVVTTESQIPHFKSGRTLG